MPVLHKLCSNLIYSITRTVKRLYIKTSVILIYIYTYFFYHIYTIFLLIQFLTALVTEPQFVYYYNIIDLHGHFNHVVFTITRWDIF